MECNATGDPPLAIDWFREGNNASIEKHGNELYDIHELGSDSGLSSFMQIRTVKGDDNLLFKCSARNEFGSAERLIKLIVLAAPDRPTQLRVRDVWSRSALVSWLSQYPTGGSRVSNYTVQYWRKNPTQNHRREQIQVDGLHSSALLVNLAPAVSYELSVIGQNQVGQSEPSEPINVTTSEEEPSAPPTDVQVEPRGPSSLRVAWKSPPAESLNGRLLGFYVGFRPRLSAGGQSAVFSFKTADALDGQLHYETFLTNLKQSHDYEVAVRAFNKAGSGPDCHALLARTNSAKLPAAPVLQLQRVSATSLSVRWTWTRSASQADSSRFVLFYQLQGDRDWYELTVGPAADHAHSGAKALPESDSLSSQVGSHSLSNLQAGLSYRIYVSAANDFGLGDPSNVISARTEPLNSTSSAFLGAGQLDGPPAPSGGLLESWTQQQPSLLFAILSSLALLLMLALVALYLLWQHKLRRNCNSSPGSSYPPSWPADTIQSEYSIKRFAPPANSNAHFDLYDDAAAARSHRPLFAHSAARPTSSLAQGRGVGTVARPLLSSHYHQPADLISSGTLQLHSALRPPLKSGQSATLNRNQNQNRQLPPIPYSTMSVKEGMASKQQVAEYRVCGQQQQVGAIQSQRLNQQLMQAQSQPQTQPQTQTQTQTQSMVGSQTPLIYGVID